MKFKYNWGWGVFVFFIIFFTFLGGFIVFSSFVRTDLVEKDYYENELKYQDQIDKMTRTKEAGVTPELIKGAATIAIKFPNVQNILDVTGKIHFYRPSNASHDRFYDIVLNENSFQTIEISRLQKGLWILKLDWKVKDISYYYEEEILINN